jgi:hypothetical protein
MFSSGIWEHSRDALLPNSMAGANSKWEFASLSWIVVGDFQKITIKGEREESEQ